jgi:hypothetical protein
MTHDEFDDLDRALAALPLEEPPAGLHARIMGATVYRPETSINVWEVWIVGTLIAIAAWLLFAVISAPAQTQAVVDQVFRWLTDSGLTSQLTLLWLAVGISTTWWLSFISIPSRRRKRIEAQ